MSVSSIGELLTAFLLADATIASLVGTRVYPLRLPQKPTLPALVVTRISGERIGQLRGAASAAEPRYQIDAWTSPETGGHKGALALGKAVRNRLEGYTGDWSDGGSPAIVVTVAVRFVTERDQFEEDILGGLCRHSADYFVFHGTAAGVL